MPIGDSDYIRPGDHVDIFGYFQKSSTIAQTRSMRILQNVTVLMVDGVAVRETDENKKKTAQTAQLLIKDSQYEALTTASNLGKLRMALCGLNHAEQEEAAVDNGQEFLTWVETSVGTKPLPTEGASPVVSEVYVSAPVAPEVKKEQHSMIVYSGGIAHEYKWEDDEMPMEVNAQESYSKPSNPPVANSAPTGKFTGTNTVWDPSSQDWTESNSNNDTPDADALLETP